MRTSSAGIQLLKQLEGCKLVAYQCSAGVWTIGYGFTKGVKKGDTMTQQQADARLLAELVEYEDAVWDATGGNVNQNEHDALVVLAWNIGITGMRNSTVIRAHNRGDKAAAARAFGLWNKAGGKVLPGLVRRRAAEAALYLTHVPHSVEEAAEPDMPQAIDPPKRMSESNINRAGIVAGGTATVAAVTETANTVSSLKYSIHELGDWLVPVLLVVVVVAIGYIVRERFIQRNKGIA